MIQRVRTRLYLIAIAFAVAATIIAAVMSPQGLDEGSARGFLWVGALVFGLSLTTGLITLALVRRSMREVAGQTRNVVRDTSRRVSLLDVEPGDELRELAEWVNFLAEDADRSHTALARERVLLSSVAEGLTQGVIAVDGDHKIELLNDAARKMLGVTSTPVGEPLIEFVRVPAVFELIEGNEAASVEVQLPNGPRTLIRVANRWGGEGRVLLLEDVTTVRRLETVRRDFVANVSHELRTPVAVIRANAETLLAGAADDPVMGPKLIDGLHRNAERLARIVADLLDLSRLDAGQYRLELSTVPLKAQMEQSLTAIGPQATAREVTIDVQVPDDLAVKADPKALDQIFVNLIDNAVKYTRAKGNVWVAARVLGDHVRIEVRDDGPGIADKHRERVFERFYRADPSRSREAGGTGLGLSIVKHLAESMGGAVGVEPKYADWQYLLAKAPEEQTCMTSLTSKEFDQELRTLREKLATMGSRAEEQVALAMRALGERDDELARHVIKSDQIIDRDENEIDELAFQILATRQPVASDLRFITMSLKFVVDVEPIGDLATGIAKRALELNRLPPLDSKVDLQRLATLAQKNLHAALDAFVKKDADAATGVISADVEIDRLNASLFAELIAHVATDPATVTRVLPLTSVCRYLERIGDHVKNLAEEVVYMVRATDVRHRPLPKSPN